MKRKGKIFIGTSGWSYKHWKNIYYPEKMKPTDYLEYYSRQFSITEINTSFYHLPRQQTVINWAAKVPPAFKFCAKLSRYITHMKKLHDAEEPLRKFFDVFDLIQPVLGPVLIQLPPSLKFNETTASGFFDALKIYKKQYDFVLEVRHVSWYQQESIDLLKKNNIGLVISQSDNHFPYSESITAENIYIRFHGPDALYASKYTDEMLREYAEKFSDWSSQGHTIWAFFNNDIHGYAYEDAAKLIKMTR